MDIITLDPVGAAILSSALLTSPVTVDISEVACMVSAVTYESIGEPVRGMKGTVNVINKRTRTGFRGAESVCDTVTSPSQFSYLNDKYPDLLVLDNGKLENAFKNVVDVSVKGVAGKVEDVTGCADHYLNPDKVARLPSWYDPEKVTGKIGDHVYLKLMKGGC